MSGWDGWANGCIERGASGAAIYCAQSGSVWGQAGDIAMEGCGGLCGFDKKAEGKDSECPKINGKKYMYIRSTESGKHGKINIFKAGSESLFTHPGPPGGRLAVYMKETKPETVLEKFKDMET